MENVIIFFSYLNIWSIKEGQGAPSFYKTITGYISDGWKVILIKPEKGEGETPKINGLAMITFKNDLLWKLIKIKKISFWGRIAYALYGYYKFITIGEKIIKKEKNSNIVLYAYEVHGVKAAKKLQKKYNLPFVARFQGTVLYNKKYSLYNRLKWFPHYDALKTEADLIIMTDDGTFGYNVLKNLNNKTKNILFLKNGIDYENTKISKERIKAIRNALNIKDTDVILMTLSRLAYWKRVDRAIIAFSKIAGKYQNSKLVIVGDGSEKQWLIKLAEELKLDDRILFAGSIMQSDVGYYFDIADIFLSLYDLGNVGNPLFEAMAASKAIITLNNGDTKSLIKNMENGILVDLMDLNMIPNYIEMLINNKALREKLGQNAKKYIKENMKSWDKRINEEIKLVKSLVKR